MARKTRDRKFPQADFEISIADAVGLLLRARDVAPDDQWVFQVDGEVLRITRVRAAEDVPEEPDPVPQGRAVR